MFNLGKQRSGQVIVTLVVAVLLPVQPPTAEAQATKPATEPPLPDRVERTTFIVAPMERVWKAFSDKKLSNDWFPFTLAEVDLRVGGKLIYGSKEDPALVCEVLEMTPVKRLVLRFKFHGGPMPLRNEPPTRVTYELQAWGPTTELHVVHDQFDGAPYSARTSPRIWDNNLARLKTLLETGKPLVFSFQEAAEQMGAEDEWEPPERYNPLAFVRRVTLYVPNLKQARPWYEEAFALPLSGFSRGWITLSMARPAITIREASKPGEKPGQVGLSFSVQNVERLYNRLKDQGVKFEQPLTDRGFVKEFTFVSPEGYRFMVQGPPTPPADAEPAPTTQPAAGR